MPLSINLSQLEHQSLHLSGEMPAKDLDLAGADELITLPTPLRYDLEVQKLDTGILVQGRLSIALKCECARCLKPFSYNLNLPDWTCLLAMEGEEAVTIQNDAIDLTPSIREDILLGFPRHPLCNADCGGLPVKKTGKTKKTGGAGQAKDSSPDWTELDKLKL